MSEKPEWYEQFLRTDFIALEMSRVTTTRLSYFALWCKQRFTPSPVGRFYPCIILHRGE